jgi:HEAT repeats
MRRLLVAGIVACACCALMAERSLAGRGFVTVGIGLGGPIYYRPYDYYDPYYGYYYPYPAYSAPPLLAQPVSTYVPVVPPAAPADANSQQAISNYLAALRSPDELVRLNSVTQLGRMRVPDAIDPLAATLAGDLSPRVREAAARAIGLIGTTQAAPALQRAAQMDCDSSVRQSAQFALDAVQPSR